MACAWSLKTICGNPASDAIAFRSSGTAPSGVANASLSGTARPITLLEIKKKTPWINEAAPSQGVLGVMLCYAPLHYLIFSFLKEFEKNPVLVMTSANRGDFPLVASENELAQIAGYADYFLVHSRPIHAKCDDSIARVFLDKEIIIRKARGYTPDFINFAAKKEIFASGAELKNTFSFCSGKYLVSSPYIGDLKNYASYRLYLKMFSHYTKIMNFKPKVAAHDLHPSYLSTQYALSLKDTRKIPVQHHHAHLAACLFENGVNKKAIGVCLDGAGLGADNAVWGGEFFVTDKRDFLRAGHFRYFGLLGSDKAVKEPARVAFYMLYKLFGENLFKLRLSCIDYFEKKEKNIFCKLIDNNEVVMASSAGRIFDAAASILGLKHEISYEAQAAVALEMFSGLARPVNKTFAFSINKENNVYVINWQDIISDIIKSLKASEKKPVIAYRFHFTFAKIIKEIAVLLRQDYGINDVALSGGVFQNFLLLKLAVRMLEKEGFSVHYHKRIPTNDSGISVGQAVVANENI